MLLHGAGALFAAALATLRAVATALAEVADFEQCYTLLKQPHLHTLESDVFVRRMVLELEQLPPPRLAQLRAPQRVAVVAEMARRDEARQAYHASAASATRKRSRAAPRRRTRGALRGLALAGVAALLALLLPTGLGLDLGPLPFWAAAPAPLQGAQADADDDLSVRAAPPWRHWRGVAAKVTGKLTRATRRVAATPVRQAASVLQRARRQYVEALAVKSSSSLSSSLGSRRELRGEAALVPLEPGQREVGHPSSSQAAQFFLGASAA